MKRKKVFRALLLLAGFVVLPAGLLLVQRLGGQFPDAKSPAVPIINKIDPRLRENTAQATTFTVFVVLQDQPHRDILERIGRAARSKMELAQSRYSDLAGLPFVSDDLRQQTRAEVDAVVQEIRRDAGQRIKAAIALEQEVIEARLIGLGAVNIQKYAVTNMLKTDIPASALPALAEDPSIAEVFPVERGLGTDIADSFAVLEDRLFNSPQTTFLVDSRLYGRNDGLARVLNNLEKSYGAQLTAPSWKTMWPVLAVRPPGTADGTCKCLAGEPPGPPAKKCSEDKQKGDKDKTSIDGTCQGTNKDCPIDEKCKKTVTWVCSDPGGERPWVPENTETKGCELKQKK
jgi:hypothetical protein